MRRDGSILKLSASDLAGRLACAHLTQLDRRAAHGELQPPVWRDPMLEILAERGLAHEAAYLDHLRERGVEVLKLAELGDGEAGLERTCAAMRDGAPAIAQAIFLDGRWHGRADVLLRVERPSELGSWSYEVVDTKLAAETRGGTVLQLCLYSDLVARVQGVLPESMFVVSPGRHAEPERFRTSGFFAYYRWVRARLERAVEPSGAGAETYPEPVPHCDFCRWWPHCDRRWRDDDHLSLVAGATRLQRRELCSREIDTLEKLGRASFPLNPRPARGSVEGYERAHEQARLQLASRGEPRPLFEPLDPIDASARPIILAVGEDFLDCASGPSGF